MSLTFLVSFLLMANSYKNDESMTFYVHGGAIKSYKNDKVTVSPQGKIALSTISPTFVKSPNTIGDFEATITDENLTSFQKKILTYKEKIKGHEHQPARGSIVEEIHVGDNKKKWTSRDDSKPINALRSEFLVLAKQAYKNPVKAISLKCSQNKPQINCAYVNVGKQTVETVDPLGVSYSISCLDIRGKKKILHELDEHNPKKMYPKKIQIKPGEEYRFSVKTDHICDHRVIVKTTDMMIHENYEDVLLGELVSNQLSN